MSFFRRFQIDLDNPSGDAYGRLRTSDPVSVFRDKQVFGDRLSIWDDQEVSGGGTTSVWDQDRASTTLGVTSAVAGRRLRQVFVHVSFEPGKSYSMLMCGILDASANGSNPGVIRRLGAFTDTDGIFFEDNGVDVGVTIRSRVTGVPVDNRVAQSAWNLDKLDGTGPSAITIDWSKIQTFVFDFQWGGRFRFGLDLDGQIVYCHEFTHANTADSIVLSKPALPPRYEIVNDGTGPAAEIEGIWVTVHTEGGEVRLGSTRFVSTGVTQLDANASGAIYAAMAVRMKTGFNGVLMIPEAYTIMADSNDALEWFLVVGPAISGDPLVWNSYAAGDSIEFAAGNTTNVITGGTPLDGGYIRGRSFIEAQSSSLVQLGAGISDIGFPVVLAVRPLSGNANVYAGMTFRTVF